MDLHIRRQFPFEQQYAVAASLLTHSKGKPAHKIHTLHINPPRQRLKAFSLNSSHGVSHLSSAIHRDLKYYLDQPNSLFST